MKNRSYSRNNPCYKSKIMYHQNKINDLVNCSPAMRNPGLLLRHMASLNHFVEKQAKIQENEIKSI
jgi:hypothetical protein